MTSGVGGRDRVVCGGKGIYIYMNIYNIKYMYVYQKLPGDGIPFPVCV